MVHFLRNINISIFKHERLTKTWPFFDITTFLFSNSRGSLKSVHFLRHMNISNFKQERLTEISPYFKIYEHFYVQTPVDDLNWSIFKDISTFLFSNNRGSLKSGHFLRYINISNFKHISSAHEIILAN